MLNSKHLSPFLGRVAFWGKTFWIWKPYFLFPYFHFSPNQRIRRGNRSLSSSLYFLYRETSNIIPCLCQTRVNTNTPRIHLSFNQTCKNMPDTPPTHERYKCQIFQDYMHQPLNIVGLIYRHFLLVNKNIFK